MKSLLVTLKLDSAGLKTIAQSLCPKFLIQLHKGTGSDLAGILAKHFLSDSLVGELSMLQKVRNLQTSQSSNLVPRNY